MVALDSDDQYDREVRGLVGHSGGHRPTMTSGTIAVNSELDTLHT